MLSFEVHGALKNWFSKDATTFYRVMHISTRVLQLKKFVHPYNLGPYQTHDPCTDYKNFMTLADLH